MIQTKDLKNTVSLESIRPAEKLFLVSNYQVINLFNKLPYGTTLSSCLKNLKGITRNRLSY